MNILMVTVAVASIAFLARFLAALVHEQRSARLSKVYLLDDSSVAKKGRFLSFVRVRLHVLGSEEFPVKSVLSASEWKVTRAQKWG